VVVALGVTVTEPLAGNSPRLAIVTEVAFVVCQTSEAEAPLVIVAGWE